MNTPKIDYKMHFAFNGVGTQIGSQIMVDFREDWGVLVAEIERLQAIEAGIKSLNTIDMGEHIAVLNTEVYENIEELVWGSA